MSHSAMRWGDGVNNGISPVRKARLRRRGQLRTTIEGRGGKKAVEMPERAIFFTDECFYVVPLQATA